MNTRSAIVAALIAVSLPACVLEDPGPPPAGERFATSAGHGPHPMGVNGDSPYQRFPAAGFTLTFDRYDTMVAGAANPAGDPDFSGREIALWEDECNCDVTSYTQPGSGHAMFFPETMRISSTPPPAGSKAAVSATGDVARTSPRGLFVSDLW